MSEPDFSHSDYESDEYFDEQGRKVQEFDYSTETVPLPPKREWPQWPQDVLFSSNDSTGSINGQDFAQDLDCDSFEQPDMEKIKPEEPSNDSPSLGESVPVSKSRAMKDFTPRSGYTWDEMTPTVRDPRCKSATELACFWPVYVGNFRCQNQHDEFDCVKQYFAWKGLHVRWWYRRIDEYYDAFQSKAGIFDMLVYFVSEQDANQAIEQCHRDNFKGYPMNVFPGRVPVYFDQRLSLQVPKMSCGRAYSELFFERKVMEKCRRDVDVTCTVKFSTKHGAMEFASVADKNEALKSVKYFKFEGIPERLQKQRFLEQDVLKEIEALLTFNPAALQANREDKYVKLLLDNKRPQVDPNPTTEVKPLRSGPPKQVMVRRHQKKMEKVQKEIVKAVQAGREPICYNKNNKNYKKRFRKMVEDAKQNL